MLQRDLENYLILFGDLFIRYTSMLNTFKRKLTAEINIYIVNYISNMYIYSVYIWSFIEDILIINYIHMYTLHNDIKRRVILERLIR